MTRSSRRSDLEERINREIRRSQVRTDAYDDAVATALGLNRTDYRCVDALGIEGPLTAGQLAKAVGVSTAAITTAIDRLERAGYARRRRDERDRRRVLVELEPKVHEAAWRYFEPLARRAQEVYAEFSEDELEVLARFLERASERFDGMVDELREQLAAE
jgi:DNA-binding MarR family transcriptional regulator